MTKKTFYAGVWLGIQSFDTVIAEAYKVEDIIGHSDTLEGCKENLLNADIKDELEIHNFAIIKVEHVEDFSTQKVANQND